MSWTVTPLANGESVISYSGLYIATVGWGSVYPATKEVASYASTELAKSIVDALCAAGIRP